MNADRMNDPQTDGIEQIEDLAVLPENAEDAEQVKGGFDPQPDPPSAPVYQPPVLRPGGIIRW